MFASDGDCQAMGGQVGPSFAAIKVAIFLLFIENKSSGACRCREFKTLRIILISSHMQCV